MKHGDLYDVEPGAELAIERERIFIVHEVSNYESGGDEWTNLTELREGGQQVVEVSNKITRWSQVLDLLGVTTDEETVDYKDHHFVRTEHNTVATVEVRSSKEPPMEKDSLTSVYRSDKDKKVFLSIEEITEKTGEKEIFVWYSDKKLTAKEIVQVVD